MPPQEEEDIPEEILHPRAKLTSKINEKITKKIYEKIYGRFVQASCDAQWMTPKKNCSAIFFWRNFFF